ncbi:MAG: hypothetical protein M1820_001472 [Bogoriella megaspora]|nr:MAG: hypothetical protein M1820_001472 [Bogoriella megaspora]
MENEWFWVDALCINQRNNLERWAQVAIMRQIYERAAGIMTWLGEASRTVLPFLAEIEKHLPIHLQPNNDLQAQAIHDPAREGQLPPQELLLHNYWRRVWILQEITTPKPRGCLTIWCSNASIDHEEFLQRVLMVRKSLDHHDSAPFEVLKNFGVQRSAASGILIDIATILRSIWMWQSTDERDKLFAPLQLSAESSSLRPDYDMPVQDAWTAFTVHLITEYRTLGVLEYLFDIDTTYAAPSWALNESRLQFQPFSHTASNSTELPYRYIKSSECSLFKQIDAYPVVKGDINIKRSWNGSLSLCISCILIDLLEIPKSMFNSGKYSASIFWVPHDLKQPGTELENWHHHRRSNVFLKWQIWENDANAAPLRVDKFTRLIRPRDILCVAFGARLPLVLRPERLRYGDTERLRYSFVACYGDWHDLTHDPLLKRVSDILIEDVTWQEQNFRFLKHIDEIQKIRAEFAERKGSTLRRVGAPTHNPEKETFGNGVDTGEATSDDDINFFDFAVPVEII